jgi:Na+/melibiose symporter-like transporter
MAFLNCITYSTQRRDRLISLRNGFTYVANLTVLSFALGLFAMINDEILQFRVLSLIIVVIGSISSIFYIVTLKEPKLAKEAKRLQKEFVNNQANL